MAKRKPPTPAAPVPAAADDGLLRDVVSLLETARHTAARAVNAVMTATDWEVGRRIVEVEQRGRERADHGARLIERLSADLTKRFGQGFSQRNVEQMRRLYRTWPIPQTPSAEFEAGRSRSIAQTPSEESPDQDPQASSATAAGDGDLEPLRTPALRFPLPWSHDVRLLSAKDDDARRFDEQEPLRRGWTERQLDRQISRQFPERTLLSRYKAAMLRKGAVPQPGDQITPEEEIKDPLVLEFLDLKDEYSEHDLEDALIHKLEDFLLELGGDFTFVGRQKRLRIGDEWYRIDLLFFHHRLRCLVVIDLKIGRFTHADSGRMHLDLNDARQHWTHEGENPPVGLILCAQRDEAVAHYALEGLPSKVMAAEYRLSLPDEETLAEELRATQRALERRGLAAPAGRRQPRKSG